MITHLAVSLLGLIHFSSASPTYQDCVLDTTGAVGTGSYTTDAAPGSDISDNAYHFPNPFAFFTNTSYPGVTLPAQRHCEALGSAFIWTTTSNTCLFDSGGYPFPYNYDGVTPVTPTCSMNRFTVSSSSFISIFNYWLSLATASNVVIDPVSSARIINVIDPTTNNIVKAAISIGHGMLNGLCGSCFLIKYNNNYVIQLQTDVRAWSLELTSQAASYINPNDYGGNCRVPQVVAVDCIQATTITNNPTTSSNNPTSATSSPTTNMVNPTSTTPTTSTSTTKAPTNPSTSVASTSASPSTSTNPTSAQPSSVSSNPTSSTPSMPSTASVSPNPTTFAPSSNVPNTLKGSAHSKFSLSSHSFLLTLCSSLFIFIYYYL